MNTKIRICKPAVLLCAWLFMIANGEAGPLADEPFDYPTGLLINGQNGGTGWSGAWADGGITSVVSPGLTYTGLMPLPVGNALGQTTNGSVSTRPLATPVIGTPGTSMVLRALIKSDVNGTPATQATLGNSSGGTLIIGDLPQLSDVKAGNWGMQIDNPPGRFYSNVPVAANATTLLISEVDFNGGAGNDRMRLWVNPNPPNTFFTQTPKIDTKGTLSQFSGVFWQTQQAQQFDEIRIDSTLSACVPPPNTTMVLWHPFDETTGSTAANLATGNTGTRINNPTPIPGMVAGALRFDGIDDYVEAPSTIATNFGPAGTQQNCQGSYSTCLGDFSIDAWIRFYNKSNTPQGVMVILDKRIDAPVIKGYSFYVYQGMLGIQLSDGINTQYNFHSALISSMYGP